MSATAPNRGSRAARGYARVVVALRHLIILAWIGMAVAATSLPYVGDVGGGGVDGFVPADNPTVQTEIASVRAFGYPLISRTVLVQRDPTGLAAGTQAEAVLRAVRLNRGEYGDLSPILGALPVTNTFELFPSSTERGTTALTYLLTTPRASFSRQTEAARDFAALHVDERDDAFIGVTGSIPARVEQGRIVGEALPLVEISTLAAIVLILSLVFRSIAAPAIALGTAGIAFVVATRLAGYGGQLLDIAIPKELEPLILALLLGVVTDYAIFFLSGMRRELAAGKSRLDAARAATESFAPIVIVAGLTVACGTASLLVAESAFFRAFGPAMALAIMVALVVAVTLVPALLAVFGRKVFWPSSPRPGSAPTPSARRGRGIALMTKRPVAVIVVLACLGGLTLAALPLREMRLGVAFIPSLPASSEASTAAAAATAGFAPGILSPTVLLVQDDAVVDRRENLSRLGDLLKSEPGVAGVVAPGDLLPALERSVLLAPSGDAARYLIVLENEPLGAQAIDTLQRVRERLPTMLERTGLTEVEVGFGGDTALASLLVRSTQADLGRIAAAALLVNFILLAAFLRALVAPLYLLACSVLALGAALGLLTYLFQDVLGNDGITFYVPFAAAVLLLSLGSDYNIFGVGHLWGQARGRPLREVIIEAVPQTTAAITAAGITLAASFGMLALVPLRPFRELAFVMAVGIMLDVVVVRSFLVPTLLTLVGRLSGWPGRVLKKIPVRPVTRAQPTLPDSPRSTTHLSRRPET